MFYPFLHVTAPGDAAPKKSKKKSKNKKGLKRKKPNKEERQANREKKQRTQKENSLLTKKTEEESPEYLAAMKSATEHKGAGGRREPCCFSFVSLGSVFFQAPCRIN